MTAATLRANPFSLSVIPPISIPWPSSSTNQSTNHQLNSSSSPSINANANSLHSTTLTSSSVQSRGKGKRKERNLLDSSPFLSISYPNNPDPDPDATQWIKQRYLECLWLGEVSNSWPHHSHSIRLAGELQRWNLAVH